MVTVVETPVRLLIQPRTPSQGVILFLKVLDMCKLFRLTLEEERQVKEFSEWVEEVKKDSSYYQTSKWEMLILELFILAMVFALGMIIQKEFNF